MPAPGAIAGEPAPTEAEVDPNAEAPAAPEPGRVELRVEGRDAPMGAQALLHVREGAPDVHLALTGAESATDLLFVDIAFAGVDATLGEHALPVGLPDGGDSTVNANMGGAYYHSQSGEIRVNLTADGLVEGSFRVALAPDEGTEQASPQIGEPPTYVESATVVELVGSFSGSWQLSCQSHIPGHSTMRFGGRYCESLPF